MPTLIMAGISVLAGYDFYAANSSEWQKWLMFAISTVEIAVFLIGGFGIKYADRGGINITVLSVIFLATTLIVQIVSTFAPFHLAPYIIINGIFILLYAGIAYALAKALD
ncbi:hypothetical protein [Treponema sp.]|uniref:hypothetical protein n=1 Tax=Treponema sp. TaxID=166 RepID=UPI003F0C8F90